MLSPLLFNLFMNDLPGILNNVECDPVFFEGKLLSSLLFADDLIIFSQSQGGLQKALIRLDTYCKKWRLMVNSKKTKVICFNTRLHLKNAVFKIGKSVIMVVDQVKYLGVWISASGSFKPTLKDLKVKGMRSFMKSFRKLNIHEGTPVKVYY